MSQINIDFQVTSIFNPKYLIVVDTSDWQLIKGKTSIIEITLPGFKDPVTLYYGQNQVNSFNSIQLGLNCQGCEIKDENLHDLPDGIYKITVKGSPSKFQFTRKFLKTDNIRLELDKLFINLGLGCAIPNKECLDLIQRIDFFLKSAESNMREGNECEAQELLFKAEKEINKLKKCKSCV